MAKNKLAGLVTGAGMPTTAPSPEHSARERRYQAEEALRTLTRASEIHRDGQLMRDVKKLAAEQMKAVVKPSGRR